MIILAAFEITAQHCTWVLCRQKHVCLLCSLQTQQNCRLVSRISLRHLEKPNPDRHCLHDHPRINSARAYRRLSKIACGCRIHQLGTPEGTLLGLDTRIESADHLGIPLFGHLQNNRREPGMNNLHTRRHWKYRRCRGPEALILSQPDHSATRQALGTGKKLVAPFTSLLISSQCGEIGKSETLNTH